MAGGFTPWASLGPRAFPVPGAASYSMLSWVSYGDGETYGCIPLW